MRIEPAVLDGDEGLRQVWRQILQGYIGAGHFAALGQHVAVEADDLDGRRPLRNFERLDRRQMRADPHDDADGGDRRPQGQHRGPIEQAREAHTGTRFRASPGSAALAAGFVFARRRIVVVHLVRLALIRLAPGRRLLRLVFLAGWDTVLRGEAQTRERSAEPELRLLASAALFPSPRHTRNARTGKRPYRSRPTLAFGV